jgi:Fe2+ transport system protein FeoA
VSPKEIIIRSEGEDRSVSSLAAANITVRPTIAKHEEQFESATRLSELKPGEQGRVLIVSRASRATERRRFMDLGILPGTVITVEFTGPGGEPVAYRIRGAVIALRKEQSTHIYVERVQENAA